MEKDPSATFWKNRAKRIAQRVNTGWWLQEFAPLAAGLLTMAAIAVWIARYFGYATPAPLAGTCIGFALLLAAAFAWSRARPRFWGEAQGLVQLENHLALRSSLTASAADRRAWPPIPSSEDLDLHAVAPTWKPAWLAAPLIALAYCILAVWLIPIATSHGNRPLPTTPPQAQEELARLLDELQEEELIEPEALEEFAERLQALRDQPEEEWYSHAAMEAADSERARLEHALEEISTNAEKTGFAATALERLSDQLTAAEREALFSDAAEGLKGLKAGDLPMSEKALGEFRKIDPSQLRSLTPEQLAKMRKAMAKTAAACKKCQGDNGKNGKSGKGSGKGSALKNWANMTDEELLAAMNKGGAPGKPRSAPGNGGIKRGRGDAPISLANSETDLDTNTPEGIASADPSAGDPTDLLGLGQGEHDLDKTPRAPTKAGAISNKARGGATLYSEDNFLPDEQEVLRNYFK